MNTHTDIQHSCFTLIPSKYWVWSETPAGG